MVFKPGHKPEKNNKQQKMTAWRFARLVRTTMMDKIEEVLWDLLNSEDENIKLGVVKELLNRGIGKVPDQLEFAGEAGGPLRITFEAVAVVKEQHVIELDEQQSSILPIPKATSRVRK